MPAYNLTVLENDGTAETGTASNDHAQSLVARAHKRPSATLALNPGGIITLTLGTGRRVILTPAAKPRMTDQQANDLEAIGQRKHIPARFDDARIKAGVYSIPVGATRALFGRGWVERSDDDSVVVSFSGRVALGLREHKARTTEPQGYHHPSDSRYPELRGVVGPWRKGGRLYDRTSSAVCSCGWSWAGEDRADASRLVGVHRSAVLASLVA